MSRARRVPGRGAAMARQVRVTSGTPCSGSQGVPSSPPWAPGNPPFLPPLSGIPCSGSRGNPLLRIPGSPRSLLSTVALPQMGLLVDPGAGESPGNAGGDGDTALEAELLLLLGGREAPEQGEPPPPPQQCKSPCPCLDPSNGDQLPPKRVCDPTRSSQPWQQLRPWRSSACRTPWRRKMRRKGRKIWRMRRSCW